MAGRFSLLAFVAGSGLVHMLATLGPVLLLAGGAVGVCALLFSALALQEALTKLRGKQAQRLGVDWQARTAAIAGAIASMCNAAGSSRPQMHATRRLGSRVFSGFGLRAGGRVPGLGRPACLRALLIVGCFFGGVLLTTWRAELRLADHLEQSNENKVSRVLLQVASLPQHSETGRRFEAEVLSSRPAGVPSRILVSWHSGVYSGPYGRKSTTSANFPEIMPGQLWSMALVLRRPHGLRNPQGFDYEAHLFAKGIRATASVRGEPQLVADKPWSSLTVLAERARYQTRKAMLPYLEGKRYGPVLLALAIGDQASVAAHDWKVFNRTGITHLVSISGTHVTLIAALGGWLVFCLTRYWRWRGKVLAERVPAQVAACLAALLIAWLYCLLAGWGIPAQRTFLMLAVVALARLARLSLSASRVLCLAAFVVVLFDPWALLASGFWLSFGAVAVLLTSQGWWGRVVRDDTVLASGPALVPLQPVLPLARVRQWRLRLRQATQLQLAISAGIMPVLAYLFHEVSIISPVVNAYAIPLISLIVTPFSLLLAAAAFVPQLAWLAKGFVLIAHEPLALAMMITEWLAGLPYASLATPAAPLWAIALAAAGMALAILPYGLPWRHAAWLLMLPALFWKPERPAIGYWQLQALDVGQAGAIVIKTRNHHFLFDTGLRTSPESDSAERTILPYLRAAGVGKLDVLVVSHADIDHVGGLRSVLESLPVGQSYTPFDLRVFLQREAALLGQPGRLPALPAADTYCYQGVKWAVDGVYFEFLWPPQDRIMAHRRQTSRERNEFGCVLKISGERHSALLTGDIGVAQEARLLEQGLGQVDVVMAGHHGSKTSSGHLFVQSMLARHAVAQAGAWNRYGHPAAQVEARWQLSGAQFWRSDRHGAIRFTSNAQGLSVRAERVAKARYWQTH